MSATHAIRAVAAFVLVLAAALRAPAAEPDRPPRQAVVTVLVKDFLRLQNDGREVGGVEFLRYFPGADQEQFPIGRWLSAETDDGEAVGIGVAAVNEDPAGNLVHTLRLERAPARTGVTVTISSLVLRREGAMPRREFPIPADASAYPEGVRAYLASTEMVVHDHPDIRAQAAELREKSGGDVLKFARGVSRLMNTKSYTSEGEPDWSQPTSVVVLAHGGSCCSSAVCAAALFRAAGIPAQLTYTPAGYVHGVVQFYVVGHGWVRMDATCGSSRMPLVRDLENRGLVRLFDTPIRMEKMKIAYGWPYYHNTLDAEYAFWSGGRRVRHIRFASKPNPDDPSDPGWVEEPFRHLVPGSFNAVLETNWWRLGEGAWDRFAAASRGAILTDGVGPFRGVIGAMAGAGFDPRLAGLIERSERYGALEPAE